jgi:glycerophosphoryl diester phosphodiesterase
VDLGYRWIETDVRATIDGHAVVFHDATLDRTTDAHGPVSAVPLALIRSARMSDGQAPITLAEALRRWPEVRFNVDVKSDDTVAAFLRAVSEADAWDRVCAAGFSTARLARLRSLAGDRLATSMGPSEVTRLLLGAPDRSAACAAQVPHRARGIPVVTRRFVRRAHRRGLHVHVWTVNDPDEMQTLLDLGVDGLITDRPTVLREVLISRGCWG